MQGVDLSDSASKTALTRIAASVVQRLEEAPDPDQIEVSGKVTAIEAENGKLVLDSFKKIYTDNQTEFVDLDGNPIEFGDIHLKDQAGSRGYQLESKTDKHEYQRIQVTRVQVVEAYQPPTIEFDGKITWIDSGNRTLWLGQKKIRTNQDTRFENHEGEPIEFGDFHLGEKIFAVAYADKTYQTVLALLIKKDAPTPIVFSGRIDSINPEDGRMVVNDRKVSTNDETELFNNEGNPIDLSSFKVGERVEVKGYEVTGAKTLTPILATRIQKQQGELDNILFEGEIAEIDKHQKTLKVGNRNVMTTETTEIQNEDGEPDRIRRPGRRATRSRSRATPSSTWWGPWWRSKSPCSRLVPPKATRSLRGSCAD